MVQQLNQQIGSGWNLNLAVTCPLVLAMPMQIRSHCCCVISANSDVAVGEIPTLARSISIGGEHGYVLPTSPMQTTIGCGGNLSLGRKMSIGIGYGAVAVTITRMAYQYNRQIGCGWNLDLGRHHVHWYWLWLAQLILNDSVFAVMQRRYLRLRHPGNSRDDNDL